jgi:hypothetical protein
MNRTRRCVFALALALLASTQTLAEGLESLDPALISIRPNADGPPTSVVLGIYLLDIDEISDVSQRFTVDMMISVNWQDPRLALPEAERTGHKRLMSLDEIWTPRGLVTNDRGLTTELPRVAEIDDLGNVLYLQRLYGDLAVDLEFEDFPFDTQILPIEIISYRYGPDEVQFSPNADIIGDDGSFSAEGWKFRIIEPLIGEYYAPGHLETRPRLTYRIEAVREYRYYIWTMIVPMALIIFMSWTVFWLPPGIVPSRIAISTASIFSLIAFGFSIRLSLPRVSYLTRADIFVVGCTLMVFIALATAVIGSRWASSDRMPRAMILNRVARWVYMPLFGVITAVAFM